MIYIKWKKKTINKLSRVEEIIPRVVRSGGLRTDCDEINLIVSRDIWRIQMESQENTKFIDVVQDKSFIMLGKFFSSSRTWVDILALRTLQASEEITNSEKYKPIESEDIDESNEFVAYVSKFSDKPFKVFSKLLPEHFSRKIALNNNTIELSFLQDAVSFVDYIILEILYSQGINIVQSKGPFLGTGERGWTALHYACSEYGTIKSLRFLLSKCDKEAMNAQTDYFCFTPVHIAAIHGKDQAVRLLVENGANIQSKDIYGRIPLYYAEQNGLKKISCLLSNDTQQHENKVCEEVSRRKMSYSSGHILAPPNSYDQLIDGWDVRASYDLIPPSVSIVNQIVRIPHSDSLNIEVLIKDFLVFKRPFIIEGVPLDYTKKRWNKRNLLTAIGHIKCNVSGIPYSEGYGGIPSTEMTLNDFVQIDWGACNEIGEALYFFSNELFDTQPQLHHDIDLPEYMNPFINSAMSWTFYLGPPASGSPFRFQGPTWEALVFGKKRWFLLPPHKGVLSREHPLKFANRLDKSISNSFNNNKKSKSEINNEAFEINEVEIDIESDLIQCLQKENDIIFIPPHWSHAAVNLSDVVGFSSEFPASNYLPFLNPESYLFETEKQNRTYSDDTQTTEEGSVPRSRGKSD